MDVSVDDRRALWALTDRHLRSAAFPAVLLVRHALRRGARRIRVVTRGDVVRVIDDGANLDDDIAIICPCLRAPTVPALHALERDHGTDLLVVSATAAWVRLEGHTTSLSCRGGAVDGNVPRQTPSTAGRNIVELRRPRGLRAAERAELGAWIIAPHADVTVDGRTIGAPLSLPSGLFHARTVHAEGGEGVIAFCLDASVSQLTVLAGGVWVAAEQGRPQGLPTVAVWNSARMPPEPNTLLTPARALMQSAGDSLARQLALSMPGLTARVQQRVRRVLVRGERLPPAFVDVPLFDGPGGAFSLSLRHIGSRSRVVVGDGVGDVWVDAEASLFLQRQLGDVIVQALPPPRRRLRFLVTQAFGQR